MIYLPFSSVDSGHAKGKLQNETDQVSCNLHIGVFYLALILGKYFPSADDAKCLNERTVLGYV